MNTCLLSMTGFGRGTAEVGRRRLIVEIRSLNGRGSDVKVRGRDGDVPAAVETEIVRAVRAQVVRGTVSVTIREEGVEAPDAPIDLAVVRQAHSVLEALRRELGLAEPVDLHTVAAFLAGPAARHVRHDEMTWEMVRPAVEQAVQEMQAMRAREGAALAADLRQRLESLRGLAEQIAQTAAGLPTRAARKLEERLAALATETAVLDAGRLAQEVALLAEKLDVSEELVRLRTHIDHLGELFAERASTAPGRKIDFLVQEVGREINTVGSKVQDAPIAALVVASKAELEKLREQAQNIE
ncbi:MAG TPA: DUF1732 domain-containing protein [Polyangia bacterium]|jgi:uncharacterized protein (TIGR00255 family)|nr:DUF1732 domain-containing protein [Polyangia bacterium]